VLPSGFLIRRLANSNTLAKAKDRRSVQRLFMHTGQVSRMGAIGLRLMPQRGIVHQPRVGQPRAGLPWVHKKIRSTPTGLSQSGCACSGLFPGAVSGRNPVGVEERGPCPRVADATLGDGTESRWDSRREKQSETHKLESPKFSRHTGLDPASRRSHPPKRNWISAFAGTTKLKL
jgi:hypothetical protein